MTPRYSFISRDYPTIEAANLPQSEILLLGNSVDDRGETATSFLSSLSDRTIKVEMNEKNQLCAAGLIGQNAHQTLKLFFRQKTKIRVEATTLGLAEIIRIIQIAREMEIPDIEFIYIEPVRYAKPENLYTDSGLPRQRDFLLTKNRNFVGLQGFNYEQSPEQIVHHVFFLGFEPARLDAAFQQKNDPDKANYGRTAVIGVPAFSPGWENNVLASHANGLKLRDFHGDILYCSASSPREAYALLWQIWTKTRRADDLFYVSPFGTKPNAVGAALFLVETSGSSYQTALYYDHPQRTNKRSVNIRRCHVWKVAFNGR